MDLYEYAGEIVRYLIRRFNLNREIVDDTETEFTMKM